MHIHSVDDCCFFSSAGLTELVQAKTARLSNAILRSLAGIRTIKAFMATVPETKRVVGTAEEVYRATVKVANKETIIRSIVNCAIQLTLLIVFSFGGAEIAKGDLDISNFISFSMYLTMVVSSLSSFSSSITTAFKALGPLRRIEDIESLRDKSETVSSSNMLSPDGHSSFDTANITLEFKDVCFSYNTADKDDERNTTLQNISFSAVPHQRTVIVGSSGSGKTTLLSLLEAFYRPDSGHILYNNVDSTDLNANDIRKVVSYIEQDAPIFSGSIRDNLTMGTIEASDETCWNALKLVNLDTKVRNLEQELNPL